MLNIMMERSASTGLNKILQYFSMRFASTLAVHIYISLCQSMGEAKDATSHHHEICMYHQSTGKVHTQQTKDKNIVKISLRILPKAMTRPVVIDAASPVMSMPIKVDANDGL